jgi:uncharacterized membrane protein
VSTQGPGNNSAAASKGSRLQGVLLVILGLVIGYFSVVLPLQEAYSKAPKISLYFKFSFLSPALILLGILAIVVPSVLTDQSFMSRGPNKLSVAGWALVVVLLIIGFGTYYLLDQQINSLGYK